MLLLQALAGSPSQFWPPSIAGWVSLVASLLALMAFAVGYGKVLNTIDGLGGRVHAIELEAKAFKEGKGALDRQIDRVLNQHEVLIKSIGEARGESIRCREDYTAMSESIGGKLDIVRGELHEQNSQVRERLSAVEAQLKGMHRT